MIDTKAIAEDMADLQKPLPKCYVASDTNAKKLHQEPAMIPPPVVLGLSVCEKVIVEERTKNVTLVSTFTKLVVDEFPTPPQKFAVYTALTGGLGDGTIDLVVSSLETNEEIHTNQLEVRFPDRLTEVRVLFRVASCSFPAAGDYQLTLMIDSEWLAQRSIRVEQREE